MYKFLILAAALVVCVSSAPHHEHGHHDHGPVTTVGAKGEPEDLDASSPAVLQRLKRALKAAHWSDDGEDVQKINKATSQKVEGTVYFMDFESKDGKHCTAKWAEEPWVSADPEHVAVECHTH